MLTLQQEDMITLTRAQKNNTAHMTFVCLGEAAHGRTPTTRPLSWPTGRSRCQHDGPRRGTGRPKAQQRGLQNCVGLDNCQAHFFGVCLRCLTVNLRWGYQNIVLVIVETPEVGLLCIISNAAS